MRRLLELWSAFASERGNVAIITAIMLPVLIGGFGIGFETAGWYQTQRSMQNAADSAAIAAASNGGASYSGEANAVTSAYGLTNGSAGVTVATSNTAACPSGGNTCYSVTITRPVPLYLMQVLGFQGDTTFNGGFAELMTATAVAKAGPGTDTYCLIALNQAGTGITANGTPFANLNGCDVFSNANAQCNGHNLNAGAGDAHHSSVGCGFVQHSNLGVLADPYSYLGADIPTTSCTPPHGVADFPQEPAKHNDPALPNVSGAGACSNVTWGACLSGSYTWGSTVFFEGDVQLCGDTNITTPAGGTQMVIVNGQLDTNGHTLKTVCLTFAADGVTCTASSGLSIIFTTDSSSNDGNTAYLHAPTETSAHNGTIDIAAPTSGTWSGVALYQDPNLTAGVDVSAAGNSPTWDISGLVYLPQANVTLSGAVNKSSNGQSCFTMVTGEVTVNGTGDIEAQGQCNHAGLTQPSEFVGSRGTLVQ
jgi:hypothetical protein